MSSIFRTEKIEQDLNLSREESFRNSTNSLVKNYRTHDNGIPRAREYSLDSIIHFSIFRGKAIKRIIEIDFDYFLWFPRKIQGFTYDVNVLKYADYCLKILEKIKNHNKTDPFLTKAKMQVYFMLNYERELDYGSNIHLRNYWKSRVNVKFYKTIRKPIENLIRQSLEPSNNSKEFNRKILDALISRFNSKIDN